MAMNTSDLVTHQFADDGRIPNNPVLPLVIYRSGIHLAGTPYPEDLVEKKFAANRDAEHLMAKADAEGRRA